MVSDVDADPASQNITVTLSVSHGTLTVRTDVGGGIVAGDSHRQRHQHGDVDRHAEPDQRHACGRYRPELSVGHSTINGADTLTVTTNDLGLNGNGGAQQVTNAFSDDHHVRSTTR